MAGLLIYATYGQAYSSVIVDDTIYERTRNELVKQHHIKIFFDKGGLTLKQLEDARNNVSNIVRRLHDGQEVNVKEELSDHFN